MTNYFLLVCRKPSGVLYLKVVNSLSVRSILENMDELNIKLLDIKPFDFDPSVYE